MNELLIINVTLMPSFTVDGPGMTITMIPFTGTATGQYFVGNILNQGMDTQKTVNGKTLLSARYMLEGTDYTGCPCHIFIENNGNDIDGFHPVLVTDSSVLRHWNDISLRATVEGHAGGIVIHIYE